MILKLLEHLCSHFIDPDTVPQACRAISEGLYLCKGSNPRLQAAWRHGESCRSAKLSVAEFWESQTSHVRASDKPIKFRRASSRGTSCPPDAGWRAAREERGACVLGSGSHSHRTLSNMFL